MKKPKYFKGVRRKHPQKDIDLQKEVKGKGDASQTHHSRSKKEIKKTSLPQESPKNYRPIPESDGKTPRKGYLFLKKFYLATQVRIWLQVWNVVAIALLVLLAWGMFHSLQMLQEQNQKRELLEAQLHKWEGVVRTYPAYRDGYLHIAAVAYELGNTSQAQDALHTALTLDPNNEIALQLEEIIAKGK